MADESRWWPQIMGHVLRYGVRADEDITRVFIGTLMVCTNGSKKHYLYRAYHKPYSGRLGFPIYKGDDLEECRDHIAEYFRTREMFPVDQE